MKNINYLDFSNNFINLAIYDSFNVQLYLEA